MEVLDDETKQLDASHHHGQTLTLLETFPHQVAGHGAIIRAKGDKICKPMARRELWFYRDLARSGRTRLPAFVPRWFGCFHIPNDVLLQVVHATSGGHNSKDDDSVAQRYQPEVVTWSEKVYHDLEQHLAAEPSGQLHRAHRPQLKIFLFEF
jgi:hypothetical protein